MSIRKLDKADWSAFFDRLSKICKGQGVKVEAASLTFGDQPEADWLPFLGITYDRKDDIVELALEGIDHLIRNPREIFADEGADALSSVEIMDGDGVKQIVSFREPLMLPPAEQ